MRIVNKSCDWLAPYPPLCMYVYVCDLTTYVVLTGQGGGYCGTVGITPSAAAVRRSLVMVLRVSSRFVF